MLATWHTLAKTYAMSTPESQLPLHGLPLESAPALDLLAGVKVLDLTTSIAGPYAGQLLADMGADVVKVEQPRRRRRRRAWGPPFLRRRVAVVPERQPQQAQRHARLSAATPGRELLHDLVRTADVVIVNLVGARAAEARASIREPRCAPSKPRLIHVSLTGFGLEGARADLPCYDLIAEGYCGVMDLTGEADSPPQKVGTPAADLLAGMDAAYGGARGAVSTASATARAATSTSRWSTA